MASGSLPTRPFLKLWTDSTTKLLFGHAQPEAGPSRPPEQEAPQPTDLFTLRSNRIRDLIYSGISPNAACDLAHKEYPDAAVELPEPAK